MAATKLDYETLVHTYGQTLVDKQIALEERMAGFGNAEFHKRLTKAREKGNESGTVYGKSLLAAAVDPVADGIRSFIEAASEGKAGRRHHAVKYLIDMDADVAALITLRVVLDGIMRQRSLQSVAVQIGSRIEAEHRFRALKEHDAKAAHYVERKIRETGDIRHRSRVMGRAVNQSGLNWVSWPEVEQLHLGIKLIEIMQEKCGLVEVIDVVRSKNRTVKYVTVTERTQAWITRQVSRCEMLTPTWLPTVLPPVNWTDTRHGGYHTHAVPQMPLVKVNKKDYLDELDNRVDDMPVVYDTINILQRTPWRINTRVLDVARQLWDHDVAAVGLPDREDVAFVQCPRCNAPVPLGRQSEGRRGSWEHECFKDVEGDPEQEADFKLWKRKAAQTHADNMKLRSKRVQVQSTLWMAEMFEDDERFFMPYTIDFRGRIYAVPQFNPQGPDLMKSLMEFAEGKPLGDGTGPGWLAIHGANVYGYDKASLEDRIGWVEERREIILAVADDPLGNLAVWAEADKPWQFLAWCFEWAGYLLEGASFVSRAAVALDGSCSGIQHFSAQLRDSAGGRATNLLPADQPSDIYQEVANVVTDKLRLEVSTCGADAGLAQQFLDLGIDRKATKRQVMTLPYGSTRYSCREYTEEWLREYRGDVLPWTEVNDIFDASQYLSTLIWNSIGEVVVAARQAMDWLQSCAKVVAGEGLPVTWTTPVGFPVLQSYPGLNHKRVKTKLGDSVIKLTLTEETREIDRKRMASAISPNFVHSMDAAHLMLSVDYAAQNNVTSFAMVHDSFGTHAADAEMLGACLRHAFVDMYREHDVLAEFRRALLGQIHEPSERDKIKPVPPKGDLDLELVKESDFFFA